MKYKRYFEKYEDSFYLKKYIERMIISLLRKTKKINFLFFMNYFPNIIFIYSVIIRGTILMACNSCDISLYA